MQYKLTVEKRDMKIGLNALRKSGKIPAIMYGPKNKAVSVVVSEKDFTKIYKGAGESSVIELLEKDADNKNASHEALIHEIDFEPVKGNVRHIDFYIIEKGKKVTVKIPLTFEGVALGVKEHGGVLVKVMHELEIEATPKDLPHEIKVDLSLLTNIDSHITAKDIKLPSGVSLVAKKDDVVVSVQAVKEEKEEVSQPIDLSAIEVEKKGKEAKEGEEVVSETASKETKSEEKKK